MILVGNQRGGANELARHLLKDENEHIEVHELRGFASETLPEALNEVYAVSRGTRCKQFLFSLSLNPPPGENVRTEAFESAVDRAEQKLGLAGQPRAIVFHEKEGRRHCHAVWSRIDAEAMKAVPLPHSKLKLQDVARELYREHGWTMPRGLVNSKERDPRNFTLAEWQQARRMGLHGRDLKAMMQECWAASDSKAAFEHALEESGILLAKGDRRGHVAVTHDGQVLSIARYVDKKAKDVRAHLGDPNELPSIEDARARMALDMGKTFQRLAQEARATFSKEQAALDARRQAMTAAHELERKKLDAAQQERWQKEAAERQERFNKGFRGLWDRMTGKHAQHAAENEKQALAALQRDREQRDGLVESQLRERRDLQQSIQAERQRQTELLLDLRSDRKTLKETLGPPEKSPAPPRPKPERRPVEPPARERTQQQPEPSKPEPPRAPAREAIARVAALRDTPATRPDQGARATEIPQRDAASRLQELRESSRQPQRTQGPEHERD